MSLSGLGHWSFIGLGMVALAISGVNVTGATIVAGPGEAGLRAAIEVANLGLLEADSPSAFYRVIALK